MVLDEVDRAIRAVQDDEGGAAGTQVRVHADSGGGRDRPWFWWSPDIERLLDEDRPAEALALAWAGMEAVEHRRPLPYGWAWGVAEIARQMQRYDLEIEVIERVLAIAEQGGTEPEPWASRLEAARRLRSEDEVRS